MSSLYASKPDHAFWRRSMAGHGAVDVDPITSVPFTIGSGDKLATAGSCFAQHISRTLQARGVPFLVTEPGPGASDDSYGVYPARFGNIYTVRQLRQLFERAYGLFEPADTAWRSRSGRYLDPFRPSIPQDGFATVEALETDRETHLLAVQAMFDGCDVFVFTLGLTEGWVSAFDGAVVPLAPGVVGDDVDPAQYRFHNFTVPEMEADLRWLIAQFRRVNPAIRIVLTVSPVALAATFEARHVLVANTYSKAALRVVAEIVATSVSGVAYFPAFEIVAGAHARSSFFAEDLRSVTPEGVAHVMSLFCKHYLAASAPAAPGLAPITAFAIAAASDSIAAEMQARQRILCDEDLLEATP